jgi:Rho-binding antiterminator
MSDDTYQPIPCADYERFERAIIHRQRLRVAWRRTDGQHHLNVLCPLDLQTRNSEEFLLAATRQGERVRIRLDRIIVSRPLD